MKEQNIISAAITYSGDNVSMHGFIAYRKDQTGKRPGILVIPEWWGLTEYIKRRAKMLAELGYIAMAVDIYGEGKVVDTPTEAGQLAKQFYDDLDMTKRRFDAAVQTIKTYAETDTQQLAAIGYCFGGTQAMNMACMGEDLKAVVSFHGGLTVAATDSNKLKAPILVCHGGADPFVPEAEVNQFKKEMADANADLTFISYEGATHAFSNPEITAVGEKFDIPLRYNEAADKGSWQAMQDFFKKYLH